jgi:GT2 family glycosyltransferase
MSIAPNASGSTASAYQRVSAILVTHNGSRWLPEVVAALSSQERPPDYLVAVDTGSTDGSRELLANSRIDLIQAPHDSGFGQAIARAVAELPPLHERIDQSDAEQERESEWLWLIHDDCAPAPDALAQLLSAVAQRPNVGVAGPKILGWHDRNHLLEIGVTLAHNGARWTGLERNERDQGQHDGDGTIPVLAVSTAGALIRRDLFEEIGGFDQNLPLFRDDVDFGMRARMAGYAVICVTQARLFHAEAAATERRAIDVADGAFHRPHLLDRRHAAFVLLANLPLWTLPWITLRIFASSVIRAFGYLLAKLPGYALDELAAVALLFTRLDRLRTARRNRRKNRLLPARVIRPYLAPWSEQIKLGAMRVRDLLLRRVERLPDPVVGNVSLSYTSASTDTDEGELLAPVATGFWRQTFARPLVLATLTVLLISLISSRSRFGPLAGGALAIVGDSSGELLRSYGESWHALGVGSPRPTHPFSALLAIFAFSAGGNPALFVSILFILAPVLAMLAMYFFLRKSGFSQIIAIASGALYGTSAILLTSITVGYLSTALLIVITPLAALVVKPIFIALAPSERRMSWRRTCAVALVLTLLAAISFQVFILAVLGFAIHLWTLRDNRELLQQRGIQYSLILFSCFIALAPWSISHITSPRYLLLDQGVPISISSPIHALTGNFQPLGVVPNYIVSIAVVMGVVALFSKRAFLESLAILGSLAGAAAISAVAITAYGNTLSSQIWPGGFLASSLFFTSIALAQLSDGRRKRLQESPLGRAHFATALVAVITCYSAATNIYWWVTEGNRAPVATNNSSVLPAFISTATENPDRPKTLILQSDSSEAGRAAQKVQSFAYVILRERDVRMGELSAMPDEVPLLTKTVSEITAGAGDAPAATLAQFGIRYLYLENGRKNNSLARKIDGIGGLTRLSATADGILWEVSGITARIKFLPKLDSKDKKSAVENEILELPSEVVGAEFDVPSAGRVQLAEVFDSRWRALHAGKVLLPIESELGLTEFAIPELGRVVLFHDGTIHRAGLSLQLASLGLLIFFALPRGRRQREFSDEELA